MTRAAARRIRAPYPAGSDAPSMLPSRERADLATWVPGGRRTGWRRGARWRGLRAPARRQPRRGDPDRCSGSRDRRPAGDERRGRVPRQRARRSRRRLPRRSPSARQPGRHAVAGRVRARVAALHARASRATAHGPHAAQHPHGDPHVPGGPLAPGPRLAPHLRLAAHPQRAGDAGRALRRRRLPHGDGHGQHLDAQAVVGGLRPHVGGLRRHPRPGAAEPAEGQVDRPRRRLALSARRPARPVGQEGADEREVIARYVVNRGHRDREEDWFAPRVFRAATRWLERNAASTQPFFLFVDSFDPHEPWESAEQVRRALRRPRPAGEGRDLPGLRPRRLPDAARDRAHEGALRGRADDGRPLARHVPRAPRRAAAERADARRRLLRPRRLARRPRLRRQVAVADVRRDGRRAAPRPASRGPRGGDVDGLPHVAARPRADRALRGGRARARGDGGDRPHAAPGAARQPATERTIQTAAYNDYVWAGRRT